MGTELFNMKGFLLSENIDCPTQRSRDESSGTTWENSSIRIPFFVSPFVPSVSQPNCHYVGYILHRFILIQAYIKLWRDFSCWSLTETGVCNRKGGGEGGKEGKYVKPVQLVHIQKLQSDKMDGIDIELCLYILQVLRSSCSKFYDLQVWWREVLYNVSISLC